MKKLIAVVLLCVGLSANAQTNNTYSQTNIIYIIQTNMAAMSNNLYGTFSYSFYGGGVVSNNLSAGVTVNTPYTNTTVYGLWVEGQANLVNIAPAGANLTFTLDRDVNGTTDLTRGYQFSSAASSATMILTLREYVPPGGKWWITNLSGGGSSATLTLSSFQYVTTNRIGL